MKKRNRFRKSEDADLFPSKDLLLSEKELTLPDRDAILSERVLYRQQERAGRTRQIRRRIVLLIICAVILAAGLLSVITETGIAVREQIVAAVSAKLAERAEQKAARQAEAGGEETSAQAANGQVADSQAAGTKRAESQGSDTREADDQGSNAGEAGDSQSAYVRGSALDTAGNPFSAADSKAPVLTMKKGDFSAVLGETVTIRDYVESIADDTAVSVSFAGGSDYTFRKPGDQELTIVAVDAAGNESRQTVSVSVSDQDRIKPVLSGVEDTVVKKGQAFDPLAGVSGEDAHDGAVPVMAVPEKVDTSRTGEVHVAYRTADAMGNSETAVRTIVVAEDIIDYEGGSFPVYWDTTAKEHQDYLVAVNRVQNTVTVYRADDAGSYTIPEKSFVCSVGADTPTGYYDTLERYRWKDLYDNCFGQYAIRIVDHFLFHSVPYFTQDPSDLEYEEYNALGTSKSQGCVRLSVEDAKWLYDHAPEGFPCVIYDDAISPGPLGKPEAIQIDTSDTAKRGWDPTDPDENNPWRE